MVFPRICLKEWCDLENIDYKIKSWQLRWQFCSKYKLEETCQQQLLKLIEKLNNLTIHDLSALDNLEILSESKRQKAIQGINKETFLNKLMDRKLLRLIWDKNISEINIVAMESIFERLYNITLDNRTALEDIVELIDDNYLQRIANIIKLNKFRKLLHNRKLLPILWDELKHIDFFKDIIVRFCAKQQNQTLVESAWLPMPLDLKKALQSLGN
jgi:hypothetical protein